MRKGHDLQHLSGQASGPLFPETRCTGAAGNREGDATPPGSTPRPGFAEFHPRTPQGSLWFRAPVRPPRLGPPAPPPHTAAPAEVRAPLAVLSAGDTPRASPAVEGSVAAPKRVGHEGPTGQTRTKSAEGERQPPAQEPSPSPSPRTGLALGRFSDGSALLVCRPSWGLGQELTFL